MRDETCPGQAFHVASVKFAPRQRVGDIFFDFFNCRIQVRASFREGFVHFDKSVGVCVAGFDCRFVFDCDGFQRLANCVVTFGFFQQFCRVGVESRVARFDVRGAQILQLVQKIIQIVAIDQKIVFHHWSNHCFASSS